MFWSNFKMQSLAQFLWDRTDGYLHNLLFIKERKLKCHLNSSVWKCQLHLCTCEGVAQAFSGVCVWVCVGVWVSESDFLTAGVRDLTCSVIWTSPGLTRQEMLLKAQCECVRKKHFMTRRMCSRLSLLRKNECDIHCSTVEPNVSSWEEKQKNTVFIF